jgi:hypothetical protein
MRTGVACGCAILTAWVASSAPPAAAQSDPPIQFTDATAAVGLADAVRGALNHAVAWGDFDGDGRLDLFLGNFADRANQPRDGANGLFRQIDGGKFERWPAPAVERRGRCSGAVFVDLDNDGDLDLYVTSNTLPRPGPREPQATAQAEPSRLFRNDGAGKFSDVSEESGACPRDLYRSRDIGVLDYDNDGLLDLFVTQDLLLVREKREAHSRLFRNRGGLRFEDVSDPVGLPRDLPALGMVVADLNDDRRPDFFVAGSNRMFLSQPGNKYREAESLRKVFEHLPLDRGEDMISGAALGDMDLDGDLDLITGPHYYPEARVHVYLNGGLRDGIPQFREVTKELGLSPLPQKAPHMEIADFDNDGLPDLYWSTYFAQGTRRWPFICRGVGIEGGLARFAVSSTAGVRRDFIRPNVAPPERVGMVYYVNGPAVDYDRDGDLDLFAGIWPEEGSRFFRNDTQGGHWLAVRVAGQRMNRMGVGAQVRLYETRGSERRLLGLQEITVNVGYSSGRAAIAHFGLGERTECDVAVRFPTRAESLTLRRVKADQWLTVREP